MQDRGALRRLPGSSPLLPGRAQEYEWRRAGIQVQGHSPAAAGANDNVGPVPVELGLGDPDRFGKVLVGQLGIDDLMSVFGKERRLHAARNRLPAVQEKDLHGVVVGHRGRPDDSVPISEVGLVSQKNPAILNWWLCGLS